MGPPMPGVSLHDRPSRRRRPGAAHPWSFPTSPADARHEPQYRGLPGSFRHPVRSREAAPRPGSVSQLSAKPRLVPPGLRPPTAHASCLSLRCRPAARGGPENHEPDRRPALGLGSRRSVGAAGTAMSAPDIAWMLVATALVLLMTPALALFYGGLVRSKNALNTMMMSVAALGFVGVAWAAVGYSLAFSEGTPLLGGLSRGFLSGVGLEAQGTIPHLLFMAYQGTFAIITAALVSGAIVERMRFAVYLAFITLWSIVVYAPVAHWVWGGGFLAKMGTLDFAGGTVVHVNAGAAALVAALVLGGRKDHARQAILPHSVPFTLLGAGLLWFGWFGFHRGRGPAANETAPPA